MYTNVSFGHFYEHFYEITGACFFVFKKKIFVPCSILWLKTGSGGLSSIHCLLLEIVS